MQECRLTANNLACQRGERLLFRGLALDLAAGQALQVKGANGIGKSSLIRILAGLLRPLTGSVERTGAVGLLDERPALDPSLPLGQAQGAHPEADLVRLLSLMLRHELVIGLECRSADNPVVDAAAQPRPDSHPQPAQETSR